MCLVFSSSPESTLTSLKTVFCYIVFPFNCSPHNLVNLIVFYFFLQEHDRQYMHIGTMVEFAFALVGKLDVINKHSFNDFKLRVGELLHSELLQDKGLPVGYCSAT